MDSPSVDIEAFSGWRIFVMKKRESREKAEGLGHKMGPFTPYGDKDYSYCENSSCKARLIVQGGKVEGDAVAHACPLTEGDGRN